MSITRLKALESHRQPALPRYPRRWAQMSQEDQLEWLKKNRPWFVEISETEEVSSCTEKTPTPRSKTHKHVIGGSGAGKSKFLEWLIRQDVKSGKGFCVIDWHGTLSSHALYCGFVRDSETKEVSPCTKK